MNNGTNGIGYVPPIFGPDETSVERYTPASLSTLGGDAHMNLKKVVNFDSVAHREQAFNGLSAGDNLINFGFGQTENLPALPTIPSAQQIVEVVKKNWLTLLIVGVIGYSLWPKD